MHSPTHRQRPYPLYQPTVSAEKGAPFNGARRVRAHAPVSGGKEGHCDTDAAHGILRVDKRAHLRYNLCAAAAHEGEMRGEPFFPLRTAPPLGAVLPPGGGVT